MYPKFMLWTTFFGIVSAVCLVLIPHPWNYIVAVPVLLLTVIFGPRGWS